MTPVNFQSFREIAGTRPNATIRADSNSGDLRVGNNNSLNRAVTWVRSKAGLYTARQKTEHKAAYEGFINALNRDVRYHDYASWAQQHLSADMAGNKPLTSRKVRQVLSHIYKDNSGPARFANSYYLNELIDQRTNLSPRLSALTDARPGANRYSLVSEQDKAQLSQRILGRIEEQGNAAGAPVSDDTARDIAQAETAGLLESYEDALSGLPQNIAADIKTVVTVSNRVSGEIVDAASALTASGKNGLTSQEHRAINAQLASSRRTLVTLQQKMIDVKQNLGDRGEAGGNREAFIGNLQSRLNEQHMDNVNLVVFHDLDLPLPEGYEAETAPDQETGHPGPADNISEAQVPDFEDLDIEEEPSAMSASVFAAYTQASTEPQVPLAAENDPRIGELRGEFDPAGVSDLELRRAIAAYDANMEDGQSASRILTLDEFTAIHAYTVDYYSSMNQSMRNDEVFDPQWRAVAWKTQQALQKLDENRLMPTTNKLFFRGITAFALEGKHEDDLFVDLAFSSTTSDAAHAKKFEEKSPSGVLLHIFGRTGVPLFGMTAYNSENEVLFHPGTQFRILLQTEQKQPLGPPVRRMVLEELSGDHQAGRSGVAEALLDPAHKAEQAPRPENTSSGYFETLYRIAEGDPLGSTQAGARRPLTADALTDR